MTGVALSPDEVLGFWFSDRARPLWFEKDAAFDAEIRASFEAAHKQAAAGRLQAWERAAESCLALVILLDQFPRNMYRGSPKAFASDGLARAVADRALAGGLDRSLPFDRRSFMYLPFEHSEDLADQQRAVDLFRALAEAQTGTLRDKGFELLEYAERHREIIAHFGRFPHRNQVLGRETTPAEAEFLREARSSF